MPKISYLKYLTSQHSDDPLFAPIPLNSNNAPWLTQLTIDLKTIKEKSTPKPKPPRKIRNSKISPKHRKYIYEVNPPSPDIIEEYSTTKVSQNYNIFTKNQYKGLEKNLKSRNVNFNIINKTRLKVFIKALLNSNIITFYGQSYNEIESILLIILEKLILKSLTYQKTPGAITVDSLLKAELDLKLNLYK